jgi:hypothetical protein
MCFKWTFGLALCLAGTAGMANAAPLNAAGRVPAMQGAVSAAAVTDDEEEQEDDAGVQQASMLDYEQTSPGPMSGSDDGCPLEDNAEYYESGPTRGFWGRAEYLYWFVQGEQTPALVTTSPLGTPQAAAGVLPGASVLFGGSPINNQGRSGGRLTLGYWFDPNETVGVENTSLFLQQAHTSFSAAGAGNPILARPFANAATGVNDADLISFPGLVSGSIGVAATTKVLGTEVNFRRMIAVNRNRRMDMLLGYRFLRFDEGLEVATNSTSTAVGGPVPVGTMFNIHDTFGTRNQFNGGNFGLRTEWFHNDRWSFDVVGKAALGGMQETVAIQGNTVTTVPGFPAVNSVGGILTQPRNLTAGVGPGGNIGTYTRTRLAAIPEVDANLHFQLTPIWRLNVGYSLLYLTNVARPGNQIDPILDPNRFPPATTPVSPHPVFTYSERSVWMQGINLGLEARF